MKVNDAKQSDCNLYLPMKRSENSTFSRFAFGIHLSSTYLFKKCNNMLLLVSRCRARLICKDSVPFGYFHYTLCCHSRLLSSALVLAPHGIHFALILHVTNLRTGKDKQSALGFWFSFCCLLKTHHVIEVGKGTEFLFKMKDLQEAGREHVKGPGMSREPGVVEVTGRSVSANEVVEWYLMGPTTDL